MSFGQGEPDVGLKVVSTYENLKQGRLQVFQIPRPTDENLIRCCRNHWKTLKLNMGLLGFAFQCFDVLAWPLFALLYPLYSSINAIETNSISDTHKLNTYWVVFSLILLFEHAFMKLLQCFSLWPYMRLLIVFLLEIPHFDGALYVYKHLICPCLSMDPQIFFSLFKKRKESLARETFLSEVERYVEDNGYESLEKLISFKSNGNDIKAVQVMTVKKETTSNQVSEAEPILTFNKDRSSAMQMTEKIIEVAADSGVLETPPSKKVQKATYDAMKINNEAKPNLTLTENHTVRAVKINEKLVQVGIGMEHSQSSKQVQKEWTCALCQLTTTCEKNLNSHLQGRKHKASYDELKASDQAFVPTIAPTSTAKTSDQPNKEPGKSIPSSGLKQEVTSNEPVQAQKKIRRRKRRSQQRPEEGKSYTSREGTKSATEAEFPVVVL